MLAHDAKCLSSSCSCAVSTACCLEVWLLVWSCSSGILALQLCVRQTLLPILPVNYLNLLIFWGTDIFNFHEIQILFITPIPATRYTVLPWWRSNSWAQFILHLSLQFSQAYKCTCPYLSVLYFIMCLCLARELFDYPRAIHIFFYIFFQKQDIQGYSPSKLCRSIKRGQIPFNLPTYIQLNQNICF